MGDSEGPKSGRGGPGEGGGLFLYLKLGKQVGQGRLASTQGGRKKRGKRFENESRGSERVGGGKGGRKEERQREVDGARERGGGKRTGIERVRWN